MSDPSRKKATLTPFDPTSNKATTDQDKIVTADFNPQTLRINYRTTGSIGMQNAKDQSATQTSRAQPTGYAASLTVELLFDNTRDGQNVRLKTSKIAAMIQGQDEGKTPTVQFQWGDFLFQGTIQSMDETLDYFSETGVPLRATVSLSMAGSKPDAKPNGAGGAGAGSSAGLSASAGAGFSASASAGFSASASVSAGVAVGTTPLTLAQGGETLQGLSGRAGVDWKAVASANNIDNPRMVPPGTVLNLNVEAGLK
jgi:hypothetical protein